MNARYRMPSITKLGGELVALGAWAIVAQLTSDRFADLHHSVVWPVAMTLNVVVFLLIAAPLWAIFRKRAPQMATLGIYCWLALYLGMLFILFPATDGP